MIRFSPRRFWSFVRRTSPLDRIAAAILALYVVSRVASALGRAVPFGTFLGFLGFAALVYFVVRLAPVVRTRLLWSLRNRLIVAYVFMAVVPVILLLTMAGVGLYLLELQIGAHLLGDDLNQHISIIAADTNSIAGALSRERDLKPDSPASPDLTATVDPILSRPSIASVIAAAQAERPNLRVYLNHGQQLVRFANGRQFSGLAEFRNHLWFASANALTVPGGQTTILVVAPVTRSILDSLPSKLAYIQLTLLDPAPPSASGANLFVLRKSRYVLGEQIASANRTMAPASNWFDLRVDGVATLDAVRADLGPESEDRPVVARFSLRVSAVNGDLLTSMGALGPVLVDILVIAALVFLVLELAALATGVVLTRTITRSVADLYEGTLHVRRGDFGHRVRVTKRDQVGALGESFNEMTSSIAELIEEQRERQRLEHEVVIAREVQQQLFPRSLPSAPGLELAAVCRPARVVSGDYYDFVALGHARVGIALADISGKGIFAALLMASLQAALRSMAPLEAGGGTAELVSRLNFHLFKNTSDDRYATLFYAVYDSKAKTLTYTNAGHLAPFLVLDGRMQALDQGGTVVGLFEDPRYTQRTIQIAPGSLLVAFSDGLTEPESVYGEEFGADRLKSEVLRNRDLPAPRLAEALVEASEQWAGTPEQADDMTVVVARMG
ncbi:MAG TPA: SpoIIE family protein phosphatase [Candidatus Acidoferrales bacterium]|nr:SpoIIE family protein phosphatase [Candidatus Acidoferrales bacterium]